MFLQGVISGLSCHIFRPAYLRTKHAHKCVGCENTRLSDCQSWGQTLAEAIKKRFQKKITSTPKSHGSMHCQSKAALGLPFGGVSKHHGLGWGMFLLGHCAFVEAFSSFAPGRWQTACRKDSLMGKWAHIT